MYFVTLCWAFNCVMSIGRHEWKDIWFFGIALITSLALAEYHRRAAKRANEPTSDEVVLAHARGHVAQLEAKNREQQKMIAGYIDLIGAANDAGMDFWWEGRTARADWSQEVRSRAIPLNINERVSVRFTEEGEAVWIAFHEGKPPEMEIPDKQGWRRCQLWHLFETFGPHIHMGCQVPFVENEIRLEIPKAKARWPRVCHLCNQNMESEADRTEWHGLGNCVPVCPTCMGSGSADDTTDPREAPCPSTREVEGKVFYCQRKGHDDDNHIYKSVPVQP